jgi:protein-tyrosine phosphatase
VKSLKIIANDLPNNSLIKHFDHCFELIDKEINENNEKVLVHCFAGISRSA